MGIKINSDELGTNVYELPDVDEENFHRLLDAISYARDDAVTDAESINLRELLDHIREESRTVE